MCQRLNTGESNNFYFGIFIHGGPLSRLGIIGLKLMVLLQSLYLKGIAWQNAIPLYLTRTETEHLTHR